MISPGDLVVVIRHPCCGARTGLYYTVRVVSPSNRIGVRCSDCGATRPQAVLVRGTAWQFPIEWVRRVPPLAELERASRPEELETT